jgi:hypothetical protein
MLRASLRLAAILYLLFPHILPAEERICASCLPKNDGDFVHREDGLTPGWIGHAGIQLTLKSDQAAAIYDFSPNRPLGKALAARGFEDWMFGQALWGAKRSVKTDLRRLKIMTARVEVLLAMQTEYDGNHFNQKGKTFKRFGGTPYFEADCVGFIEGLHEHTGDDLTPEPSEGRILTVQTQRDESFSFEVGR